jgi:hypothetical protein
MCDIECVCVCVCVCACVCICCIGVDRHLSLFLILESKKVTLTLLELKNPKKYLLNWRVGKKEKKNINE